jgi:hypothetical protein
MVSYAQKNALKSITHNICYNLVNIIDEFLSFDEFKIAKIVG